VPAMTASLLGAAPASVARVFTVVTPLDRRWAMIADMVGSPAPFDPCPTSEAGYETARQHLRAVFTRWAEHNSTELGPDSFEELVHYKWGYLTGLRPSPTSRCGDHCHVGVSFG